MLLMISSATTVAGSCADVCLAYASNGAGMTLSGCQEGLTDCVSECGADSCIGSGPACGSGQCRCCTDAGCEETSCQNNGANTTTAAPITTTAAPITTTAAPTSGCASICMNYASNGAGMTLSGCQQGLTDCVSECGAESCIGSGPACGSGQCRCCTDAGCEVTSCQNNDATTTTTETPVTTTITTGAAPNNKTSDYPRKTSEKCFAVLQR